MEANLKLTYRLRDIVWIVLMSPFSWQCQNLSLLSLLFVTDWRVVARIKRKWEWSDIWKYVFARDCRAKITLCTILYCTMQNVCVLNFWQNSPLRAFWCLQHLTFLPSVYPGSSWHRRSCSLCVALAWPDQKTPCPGSWAGRSRPAWLCSEKTKIKASKVNIKVKCYKIDT